MKAHLREAQKFEKPLAREVWGSLPSRPSTLSSTNKRPPERTALCLFGVGRALAGRTPGATYDWRCCDSPGRAADDRSDRARDHRAGSCPNSGAANALFRCITARAEG